MRRTPQRGVSPRTFGSCTLLYLSVLCHAALISALAAVPVAAAPAVTNISRDLLDRSPNTIVDVIVQFKRPPQAADLTEITARGGSLKRSFRNIPAAVFQVPVQALAGIANLQQVFYISPDRELAGKLEFAAPAVGADTAFTSGWTGNGVGIAIVDSGVNGEHPDVKGRIVKAENFVPTETTTDDLYGHGTHVAVAAAGNAAASTEIATRSHFAASRHGQTSSISACSTLTATAQTQP